MSALTRSSGAHFDEDCITIRAIDEAVAIRYPGLPRRSVSSLEHRLFAILEEYGLAREHVHKFVLVFMSFLSATSRLSSSMPTGSASGLPCSTAPYRVAHEERAAEK